MWEAAWHLNLWWIEIFLNPFLDLLPFWQRKQVVQARLSFQVSCRIIFSVITMGAIIHSGSKRQAIKDNSLRKVYWEASWSIFDNFLWKVYHSGSFTAVQELDGLQFHFRCVQILAFPKHSAAWLQTLLNLSHPSPSGESTLDQRHTTELLQCFGRNERNHPYENVCWQDQ